MTPSSKIFVAGHRGLVGSAVLTQLKARGYSNLVTVSREEAVCDLRDPAFVEWLFSAHCFDYVFMCAARVGGIKDNIQNPLEFFLDNIHMQVNVLTCAAKYGVKKLIFLGSSCIYPRDCPQPIKEEYLLSGPIEPSTEPYALAKISGVKMCQWLQRTKGVHFISAMPCNLFGPNDRFHPEKSHLIPGMMTRMQIAMDNHNEQFSVWGSGRQTREVLYSGDAADGLLFLMEHYDGDSPINLGSGIETSVGHIARELSGVMGFKGELVFDTSQPEGTPRKVLDVSRMSDLGWKPRTPLTDALYATRENFLTLRAAGKLRS